MRERYIEMIFDIRGSWAVSREVAKIYFVSVHGRFHNSSTLDVISKAVVKAGSSANVSASTNSAQRHAQHIYSS